MWSAIGAIGAAVVGGMMSDDGGGGQSYQQAQQISEEEKALIREQTETAKRQRQISDEQYELYKTETLPLIRETTANIKIPGGEAEAMAEAAGEVKGQYAIAREQIGRDLELARGPADPIYGEVMKDVRSAESADVAKAITAARNFNRDREWNRRLQAITAYGDPRGAAMTGINASGNQYGSAAGRLGDLSASYLRAGALADANATRAGYAYGSLAQPIIKGGIDYFRRPSAFSPAPYEAVDVQTGYSNFPGGDYYTGGYEHGGAIKRRYAEGGAIEGPGTGTSDSVPLKKAPGTYILSADTVRAIGTKKVDDLMAKAGVRPGSGNESDPGGVPIRASNGEVAIPPQVTTYYGEEFFNKLQQKYHRPVLDETGMANGGAIRKRVLPRSVEDAILRSIPAKAIGR